MVWAWIKNTVILPQGQKGWCQMKWTKMLAVLGLVLALGLVSVSLAAEDTWTKKADMPTARNLLSTCVVDGKLYAIGGAFSPTSGSSAVDEYDPSTDKWTKRANLPQATCGLSTSAIDGKIYAIGGATSPVGAARSSVYVYDPATDTWTQHAQMPTPRVISSAGVVDGKIYVIGGAPSVFSRAYKTVEEYDPATDTWTRKEDMPTARCTHSAGVVDGKIYAIGGMVGGPTPWTGLSVVEAYDPATDTWTRKADMPTGILCHSVSAVDGKIYSMGGGTSNTDAVATLEEYDPITDTWTRKANMPTARWGLSSSAADGKIYAVGGALVSNVAVPTLEEYDTGLVGVPSPDFNVDETVDFKDLAMLAQYWQQDESSVDIGPTPFGDGLIDWQDLIVLCEYWLQEVPSASLVAHWKLDETEGAVAHDSVGGRVANLINGPVWQPTGGKVDGALQFDGTDDYVDTDFVLKPGQHSFSVFLWVKGEVPGQVILSQVGGVKWFYTLLPMGWLMTNLGQHGAALLSQTAITDGQWHRIGFTWDQTNRILYVDDVDVAKDTQSSLAGSQGSLYIGAGKDREPGSFFSGLIDDVKIYSRAILP
jgi:N-acetylneuraminic acid mutarotase